MLELGEELAWEMGRGLIVALVDFGEEEGMGGLGRLFESGMEVEYN